MSHFCGRSPQGECGLKCEHGVMRHRRLGRSPQGECGLKSEPDDARLREARSLPARGVWIEMSTRSSSPRAPSRSPQGECGLKYHRYRIPDTADRRSPQGECGLKLNLQRILRSLSMTSLPARGVWIEIEPHRGIRLQGRVAPRKGSVD